jgi:hypothetical protein
MEPDSELSFVFGRLPWHGCRGRRCWLRWCVVPGRPSFECDGNKCVLEFSHFRLRPYHDTCHHAHCPGGAE